MSRPSLPPTRVIGKNSPSPPPPKYSPYNGQITYPLPYTRTERTTCAEYSVFTKNYHFKSFS